MKMCVLLPVVVLLLAVTSAVPVADAQPAGHDSVVGSARDCTLPERCPADASPFLWIDFTADAHSGPAGQDPTGTITWGERVVADFVRSETHVTCLLVTDRVAIIGVEGTKISTRFGFSLSIAGLIRVTDGGGPASGLDTFEFDIRQGPFPPPFPPPPPLPGPTDCSSFPTGAPVHINEEGDLVVTDVAPFPTSEQQCKGGGWRNFPGFKNQGDCVSFVATGGRNRPAGS